MNSTVKYSIAWILLPFVAILNGLIREFVYREAVGNLAAHQISSFTLIILITLYVRLLNDKIDLPSKSSAIVVGCVWLLLTITFEFVLSYVIMGNPINIVLEDYNIFKGKLWSLVLLWVFFAPLILRNQKTLKKYKVKLEEE